MEVNRIPVIETVSHHLSRFAGFVPRVAQKLDPAGWLLAVQHHANQEDCKVNRRVL
jgi:hypothetical protein